MVLPLGAPSYVYTSKGVDDPGYMVLVQHHQAFKRTGIYESGQFPQGSQTIDREVPEEAWDQLQNAYWKLEGRAGDWPSPAVDPVWDEEASLRLVVGTASTGEINARAGDSAEKFQAIRQAVAPVLALFEKTSQFPSISGLTSLTQLGQAHLRCRPFDLVGVISMLPQDQPRTEPGTAQTRLRCPEPRSRPRRCRTARE